MQALLIYEKAIFLPCSYLYQTEQIIMTDGLLIKLRLLTDYRLTPVISLEAFSSPFITANKQLVKLQGSILLIVFRAFTKG